jgi:hypothetical protein
MGGGVLGVLRNGALHVRQQLAGRQPLFELRHSAEFVHKYIDRLFTRGPPKVSFTKTQ